MQPLPPGDPTVPPRKPEGAGAAFWITLILSAFLAWSSVGLLAAQAVSNNFQAIQSRMTARAGAQALPPEFERMMEMQRAIVAASRPDFAAPVGALGLVVAIAGIVCAVRLNRRRSDSVEWLSHVTVAILALEVIGVLQSLQIQRRVQPLMIEFMNTIPRMASPHEAPPLMKMMGTAMSGVTTMTLIMTVGWGLAKIAGCLYARHAARKPAVRAWLAG